MRCDRCKYWKKHPSKDAMWGDCKMLPSRDSDWIDFYTNNRDGEWVETMVETLPDFFCKMFAEVENDNS